MATEEATPVVGFDGFDGVKGDGCVHCGLPFHEHDKERVTDDKGPAGSYYYKRICPKQ